MPVIVMGMHRSGTSAITRCLNLMGLSVGPEAGLIPPAADNPRGYWENAILTQLNEDILAAFQGSSAVPPHLTDEWWKDERLSDIRERARRALFEVYGDSDQWCWKDPRICLTLPFWLDLLPVRPILVFIHRHPLEVFRSLEARDKLSKRTVLSLWAVYQCYTLKAMANLPVFVLRFEDLLSANSSVFAHLKTFFERNGLTGLTLPDKELLSEFIAPQLRHWRCSDESFWSNPEVSDDQRDIFRLLTQLPVETACFPSSCRPSELNLLENLYRLTHDMYVREQQERRACVEWLENDLAAAKRAAEQAEEQKAAWRKVAEERDQALAELESINQWHEQTERNLQENIRRLEATIREREQTERNLQERICRLEVMIQQSGWASAAATAPASTTGPAPGDTALEQMVAELLQNSRQLAITQSTLGYRLLQKMQTLLPAESRFGRMFRRAIRKVLRA